MRILIISTYDIKGGAATAAFRLHKSLLNEGIDSLMLVQFKSTDHFTIIEPKSKIGKVKALASLYLNGLLVKLYKKKTKTLFNPAFVPFNAIVDRINKLNPDIVHLHWISDGMMSIKDISRIKVPIIWSLHDMWPFTGGCHYDEECQRYQDSCGKCKVLNSQKDYDLSAWSYRQKRKYLSSKTNIHFIGLSRWMQKSILTSSLFKDKLVYNIPNPIDSIFFAPIEKTVARQILNLPKEKKIILFGAMNATSDPRKGFKELISALTSMNTTSTIELVIFGSNTPKESLPLNFKAHYLGHINDEISLRVVYSAADVMVVPSLQENLSNAIMESLACGTPVVAFNIGGNSDLIEHQKNGYLAQPFDCKDIAFGINWVINNEKYEELAINAREKIKNEFDSTLIAKKYIQIYKNVLDSNY